MIRAAAQTESIGESERYEVAYCTQAGHGARLIPAGTLTGVHVVRTPHYIQYTGTGQFTSTFFEIRDS